MLWASASRLRITTRMAKTKKGMRTERITASASVNVRQDSLTRALRKFHSTIDSDRKGRYWCTFMWNSVEYSTPSEPTMMPVDSVSQNGPSTEPR